MLNNLLEKMSGQQPINKPPGWDAYKAMFSTCDKYNINVSKFVWPYRHSHWTSHFDNNFQVHIALNTIAIWHEMHPNQDCGSTKSLLIALASELHNRCILNDLPAHQW